MPTQPRNVFLLVADAFRADVFHEFSHTLPAFVHGVNYTNAVATASATAHSFPALLMGVYMDKTGYGLPAHEYRTLAETLTEAGFSCGLWSDNHLIGPEYNYDRGFDGRISDDENWKKRMQLLVQQVPSERFFDFAKDAYFSLLRPVLNTVSSDSTYYKDADSINDSILAWLDRSDAEQKFVCAHYMDTHQPFEPPEEYLRDESFTQSRTRNELSKLSSELIISNQGAGFSEEDLQDVWTAYVASCKFWLDATAGFLRTLRERGHYDPERDLLVITADHGEGFDPEKLEMVGHTPTPSFWDDVVRVPLVISDPNWPEQTVSGQVSLIDLLPTILDRTHTAVPEHVDGNPARDPTDLTRPYTYFTAKGPERYYHGIRGAESKLFADRINRTAGSDQMSSRENDVSREVFTNLSFGDETVLFTREVDSEETPTEQYEQFKELRSTLERNHRPALVTDAGESVSEEVEEHLKDLGYVDDVGGNV